MKATEQLTYEGRAAAVWKLRTRSMGRTKRTTTLRHARNLENEQW